jgi:hypothetical protein
LDGDVFNDQIHILKIRLSMIWTER